MNLEYPLDQSFVSFKFVDILIFPKQHKYILVGRNSQQTDFSILVIRKTKSNETCRRLYQILTTVEGTFNEEDLLLQLGKHVRKPEENQKIQTIGILGFVRFLQGYYIVYVEEKEKISKIGRHKVNLIKKTGILPLFQSVNNNKTLDSEKQYLELFKSYKLQNCYYSYSYDLTNPLSINMSRNSVQLFRNDVKHDQKQQDDYYYGKDRSIRQSCEIFLWTYNLLKEVSNIVKRKWILPVIHGYCKQINIKVKGSIFNVIIISRRSRHHAGTRYIKRGINSYGFVANFVETEQIVINQSTSQDTKPVCSSFLGVRGSAPVFWMQEPNFLKAKPPIQMVKSDPLLYSTRKHFCDLITRYGQVLYCFNLMKMVEKTPRETILCKQFSNAIDFINKNDLPQDHGIHYIHFDYKANQKIVDKKIFIEKMHCMIYHCIMKMGLFVCLNSSRLDHSQYIEFQNGVIRTNCVDCLDRTNSFQQLMGETALSIQICKLLKQDINLDICKDDESVFKQYRALYEEMGDLISIQYGSSLAHKQKVNQTSGKRFQFLTSLTRHYNNNFTDNTRQQQIDVFLGNCCPEEEKVWQQKPQITFFPCRDLKRYSRKGWHQEAFANFKKLNRLQMFQKLKHTQLLEKFFNVNNECRWNTDTKQLEAFFTESIVQKICNTKQKPQVLTFCVQPNLKLSKKVWRALNPKSRNLTKMQNKLSRPYYRNTYNSSSNNILVRKISENKLQSDYQQDQGTIFLNIVQSPTRKSSLEFFNTYHQKQYFKLPQKQLDHQDLNAIFMYRSKATITDDMIWDDLSLMNAASNLAPETSLYDHPISQFEWKNMEHNIMNKNYIDGCVLQHSQFFLGSSPSSTKYRREVEKESPTAKKRKLVTAPSFKKTKILT